MMYQEFMDLAGYEVTFEDYNNIIEPMYMATTLSKADFIACLDKKRFALKTDRQLINAMKKAAGRLADVCGRFRDFETEDQLEKLAREYATRFWGYHPAVDTVWYSFKLDYEYPGMRGCSYPIALQIWYQGPVTASLMKEITF